MSAPRSYSGGHTSSYHPTTPTYRPKANNGVTQQHHANNNNNQQRREHNDDNHNHNQPSYNGNNNWGTGSYWPGYNNYNNYNTYDNYNTYVQPSGGWGWPCVKTTVGAVWLKLSVTESLSGPSSNLCVDLVCLQALERVTDVCLYLCVHLCAVHCPAGPSCIRPEVCPINTEWLDEACECVQQVSVMLFGFETTCWQPTTEINSSTCLSGKPRHNLYGGKCPGPGALSLPLECSLPAACTMC